VISNRRYTTGEVVARLGTTYERFAAAIARRRVTRPAVKVGVSFLWSDEEFERAREEFAAVKQRAQKPWSGRRTLTQEATHEG
jgi:hypothetical protein